MHVLCFRKGSGWVGVMTFVVDGKRRWCSWVDDVFLKKASGWVRVMTFVGDGKRRLCSWVDDILCLPSRLRTEMLWIIYFCGNGDRKLQVIGSPQQATHFTNSRNDAEKDRHLTGIAILKTIQTFNTNIKRTPNYVPKQGFFNKNVSPKTCQKRHLSKIEQTKMLQP